MNVYFILILLTNISQAAKPIIVPVDGNQYLTINDLKDLKIGFLIFVITSLFSLIRWVWSFFSGRDKELGDRVKQLEKNSDIMMSKLDYMTNLVAQIKDGQLSESEVRNLIRNEHEFIEKLKRRN